jgi:hypothetical protein
MSLSNSFSSTDNRAVTLQTPLLNLEFQKHVVEFTSPLPKKVEELTRDTGGFVFCQQLARHFKATVEL